MHAGLECRHLQTPFAVSVATGWWKDIRGELAAIIALLRPPWVLVSWLGWRFSSRAELELKLIALRHQVVVLNRQRLRSRPGGTRDEVEPGGEARW